MGIDKRQPNDKELTNGSQITTTDVRGILEMKELCVKEGPEAGRT